MGREGAERSGLVVHHVLVEGGWAAHGLACVVDDRIEPGARRQQVRAERLDTGRVAEVETEHLEPITPLCEVRFGGVALRCVTGEACRHDQLGTAAQQFDARLVADLHAAAGEQHDHPGHVGEFAALGEVQRGALGAQLVVEVMDLAVADLADVAVLRFDGFAERCLVRNVDDLVLLEVRRRMEVGCREHRPAAQRADAGLTENLVVTLRLLTASLLLQQLGSTPSDLRIGTEHVTRRIEESGLLGRVEFVHQLGSRNDVTEHSHCIQQPPTNVLVRLSIGGHRRNLPSAP